MARWLAHFQPATLHLYALTPFAFYTQYYILKNGTFFTEGYPAAQGGGQSAVIGGFGGFSGASGDLVAEDMVQYQRMPEHPFQGQFPVGSQR